jgi:exopolysaccharide biosynthesis WecB/TagA/CpsF family protein
MTALLTPSTGAPDLVRAVNVPPHATCWPPKHDLFGVRLSATTYDECVALLMDAARRRVPAVAAHLAVHAVVTAATDPAQRERVNAFDIAAPDGQPVRAALNWFFGAGLADRVYGPELMLRLCRAAAREGVGVYLYGSTPEVIARLTRRLPELAPGLTIAGAESPPFRPLTPAEDAETVRRINDSGAGLVFIGLGCPRQEIFAAAHRESIRAVQLCVGAAFDFHAGSKRMAPRWMQRWSLEWLFRLGQEPRRLFKRYLVTNTAFCLLFARKCVTGR